MKRRTHRWINGARGAISLLLAMLLLPFFSLAAMLVEAGRYQSAVKTLDGALGSSAVSTLANFDSYLKNRFGLLAVNQDGDLTGTLSGYMNAAQLTDLAAVDLNSLSAEGMYPLADTTVLRRQVLEYSKVLVPARVATDGIGIDELVKKLEKATKMVPLLDTISSGCDAVSAEADALSALEDAKDAAEDVQDSVGEYNSTFTAWQNAVTPLISHMATARPSDEKEAKEWDKTRDDLRKTAEDARKDYEKAIDALIGDLDDLQKKADEAISAASKFAASTTKFAVTAADSGQKLDTDATTLTGDDKKDLENASKTNSAIYSAVNSGTSDINNSIQDCLNSFDNEKLLAASRQLQADKSAVSGYSTDAVSGTSQTPQASAYHTADVSNLADVDALNEILDSGVEEVNQNGLFDFVSSMLTVLNTMFKTKTVFDPALNSRLDTDYYDSAIGGLPGEKNRGQSANALPTGNAADEERSKEYLAAIDPDYDPADPYGTGSDFNTSRIEDIMRDLRRMMNAAEDVKDSFGKLSKLKDFLEAIVDLLDAIIDLIADTVLFLGEMVVRVAQLLGEAAYERLLVNGYLAYNLPNRTTYKSEKTLTGYSFSKIPYGDIPNEELYQVPGVGGLAALVSALAGGGGYTNKSFSGAELEYILWGFNSEIGNQSMQFMALYLVRLLLDLPVLMSNQEVQSYISLAGPLAPLVAVIYIFGEPFADTLVLVNRGDVPLIKTKPYLTIEGLPDLVGEFTTLPMTDDMSSKIESEASKMTGLTIYNTAEKTPEGNKPNEDTELLSMDYTEYALLMMMIFGSEETYLRRLTTIIQTESTAYREQNRSLSQVAAGTSKSFDIDKSYTVIRAQAEGSLVQVLPVPSLSTSSVFRVDRVIYRGY